MSTSFIHNPEQYLRYTGLKVRKADWVSFIMNIGFKEYAKRCVVEEEVTREAQELRFMDKLAQMGKS